MSVNLNRRNSWPAPCFVCGANVKAQMGTLLLSSEIDDPPANAKKWLTLCNSKPCTASVVGEEAVEAAEQLAILADGTICMPVDEKLNPYKRAMGSWNGPRRVWVASPHRRDRDHVLRVAAKLGLEVSPEYAAYTAPKPVREAVARARAIETIREYQVEGVRRIAYVGIDDAEGCEDEARFDPKDKMRGLVCADEMGLGKTIQSLLAVHDDESLVVVCPYSAKEVWPREAKKWRPGRFHTFTVIEGEDNFRWPADPGEMVIINYDILLHTPAQVDDEHEHAHAKLNGWTADPDNKYVKWKRKDITGLYKQRARLTRKARRCTATWGHFATTADRHRLFATMLDLAEVAAKIKRVKQLLVRNAKRAELGKPTCPVFAVADELHYVETHKTQRAKRWRYLAGRARRVLGLTGTPVESEPLKLWGLMTSASANPFGFTSFIEQFNGHKKDFGGYEFKRNLPPPGSTAKGSVIVEPGTTEQLQRCLLRRTKAEVLPELPPKIFSEIPVPITPKMRKQLDELTAEYAPELLEGEIPPFAALSATLKALAKMCIPTMLDVVASHEMQGEPLIVFSANRSPVEALAKRKGWFTVLGGSKQRSMGEIQDAFQAGEGVGVAGTQAMAEAVTLTRASTIIQVIPFMSRKKNQQAYDRAHRIGQEDTLSILLIVPDHVLIHHIMALLVSKDQFVADVLEGESAPEVAPSRFVDEDADAWAARAQAKRDADAKREQAREQRNQLKRERELAALASREVTPKLSEKRAQARAQRLGIEVKHSVDAGTVNEALAYMLSICDGAETKDDQGFNRPDGCVARWLAPGVAKGSKYAVASAVTILRHYPRQLRGEFPTVFATP